jgi:predicted DNA-binding protein
MPVSVRMDPLLQKQLEAEAKKRGITRSQFIIDAVERALGHKDPYKLLLQVQEEFKDELAAERRAARRGTAGVDAGPPTTGDRVRAVLRKKRERLPQAA